MKEITTFDKSEVYKEKVAPLVEECMRVCSSENIPAFFTCAVVNNEEKTEYESDMHSAVSNQIVLKEDKIVKMANVLNGFDVVANHNPIEIDM